MTSCLKEGCINEATGYEYLTRFSFCSTECQSQFRLSGYPYLDDKKGHVHNFKNKMNKLWIDHILWTRFYILFFINEHEKEEIDLTLKRLLKNQTDIANLVKPFYGKENSKKLESLLKEHIQFAGELVSIAKKQRDAGGMTGAFAIEFKNMNDKWYQNAKDISLFLHRANPENWKYNDLWNLMKGHLDQTLKEATLILQKKYKEDIKNYEEITHHILMMADTLSDGIIKQFGEKMFII